MSIETEIKEIEKMMGVEAYEFKMPHQWKIIRKPDWTYGLTFEREFTVYEHREMGYTVAVYTERHRAQFVNPDGEDIMGMVEKVVSVQQVEAYQTRLGTKYRFV